METETIEIPKEAFTKILLDVEVLITDVEKVLERKVLLRKADIETGEVKGRTEAELDSYLKKRGVKLG